MQIDLEGDLPQLKEVVLLIPKSIEADQLKSWMGMTSFVEEGCILHTASLGSTQYFLWENFSRDEQENNEHMLQLRRFLEKRHHCYLFFIVPQHSRNGNSRRFLERIKQMFVDPWQSKICVVEKK